MARLETQEADKALLEKEAAVKAEEERITAERAEAEVAATKAKAKEEAAAEAKAAEEVAQRQAWEEAVEAEAQRKAKEKAATVEQSQFHTSQAQAEKVQLGRSSAPGVPSQRGMDTLGGRRRGPKALPSRPLHPSSQYRPTFGDNLHGSLSNFLRDESEVESRRRRQESKVEKAQLGDGGAVAPGRQLQPGTGRMGSARGALNGPLSRRSGASSQYRPKFGDNAQGRQLTNFRGAYGAESRRKRRDGELGKEDR